MNTHTNWYCCWPNSALRRNCKLMRSVEMSWMKTFLSSASLSLSSSLLFYHFPTPSLQGSLTGCEQASSSVPIRPLHYQPSLKVWCLCSWRLFFNIYISSHSGAITVNQPTPLSPWGVITSWSVWCHGACSHGAHLRLHAQEMPQDPLLDMSASLISHGISLPLCLFSQLMRFLYIYILYIIFLYIYILWVEVMWALVQLMTHWKSVCFCEEKIAFRWVIVMLLFWCSSTI